MPKAPRSIPKRARHKKWIKRAKGYRGRRKAVFKIAKEAVLTAGQHAYHDRRKKKSNFRALWQIRINAAARQHGLSYSRFIQALRAHEVTIDRKILSELAQNHADVFKAIVEKAKSA
ncbi:MAG: 50S ribosomal protein L20 [Candidatus Andersenbacteria bacterium]|nr:50S ribosomal protein L20 [Candidatus Andersenbacteria bacterium]